MSEKKNGYIYYEYKEKTEKEEIAKTALSSFFHWMSGIVAVLFIIFLVVMLFFRPVTVSGPSMEPTLHDGDRLFVYSFMYEPENGDVIVARSPDGADMPVIKRVIAKEGQVVEVDYENGTVTVDGVVLEENYISGMSKVPQNEIEYPYTVPADRIFVMGDYRDESRDSRHKTFGCIDENTVAGKAVFRFYPFSSMTEV